MRKHAWLAITLSLLILFACSTLINPVGQSVARAQTAATPTPDLISLQATLTGLDAQSTAATAEQARLTGEAQQLLSHLQASAAKLQSQAAAARQAALNQAFGAAAQQFSDVSAGLSVLTQTAQTQWTRIAADQTALSQRLDTIGHQQTSLATQVASGVQTVQQSQIEQRQHAQVDDAFRWGVLILLGLTAIIVSVLMLRAVRRLPIGLGQSSQPVLVPMATVAPSESAAATVDGASGQVVESDAENSGRMPATVRYVDDPQAVAALAALFNSHD
jgi:hypothetical protein